MPAPEAAFWLLVGDTPTGPFPLVVVHEKLAAGEVTWDTRACPVGATDWLPLRQTPGVGPDVHEPPLAPPGRPSPPPRPADVSAGGPTAVSPSGQKWGWAGLGLAIAVVAAVFKFGGAKPSPPTTPAVSLPTVSLPSAPAGTGGPPVAPGPAARPQLRVTGRDATPELLELARGLTPEETLALGLGVVLTGTDTYAARVRIANTGNVPIRVFPENLRIHFGGDAAGVTTVNHPGFLQRGVLRPDFYFEGLVMFRARVDVGAAIRLGGGGLSYDDDTVEVTYGP